MSTFVPRWKVADFSRDPKKRTDKTEKSPSPPTFCQFVSSIPGDNEKNNALEETVEGSDLSADIFQVLGNRTHKTDKSILENTFKDVTDKTDQSAEPASLPSTCVFHIGHPADLCTRCGHNLPEHWTQRLTGRIALVDASRIVVALSAMALFTRAD